MATTPSTTESKLFGILAEYPHPGALMTAAKKVAQAGYNKFDVYSPFPIHGMDDAMGLKPSKLGWIVFLHAILGFTAGISLIIYTMVIDYPINISGKPLLNLPAFVPVTFELTILLSAFGAVFGMFFLNGLPKHHNPLFNSERFKGVTNDKFFVCIEAGDSLFNEEKVMKVLKDAGATHIEHVYDED